MVAAAASVVLCGALGACSEAPLRPGLTDAPLSTSGPSLTVAAINTGDAVTPAEEQAGEVLARGLAIALNTAPLRAEVKSALAASGVRERKLHFRSYMQGRGGNIVSAMARYAGITPADFQRELGTVRDLEFYMPVEAHRAAWTGEEPVLVAVQLDEDVAPIIFNSMGNRVPASLDAPPAEPVLVIVPTETNFTAQDRLNLVGRAENDCLVNRGETLEAAGSRCHPDTPLVHSAAVFAPPAPSGPQRSSIASDPRVLGLYGTFFRVMDAKEPWARGDPEIEIHVTGRRAGPTGAAKDFQCSGEHANEPGNSPQPGIFSQSYVYDQNGNFWNGSVLIASPSQIDTLQTNANDGFNVALWEDDNVACQINQKNTADYFKNLVNGVAGIVNGFVAITAGPKTGGGTLNYGTAASSFGSAINELYQLALGGDDFIGVLVEKDSTSYRGQYPGNTHIIYDGTTFNGRATLEMKLTDDSSGTPGVVTIVDMTPTTDTVGVSYGRQFTAYAYDANGQYVPDATFVWSTTDANVAPVSASGFVTGQSSGTATISVTSNGVTTSTPVTIAPPPPFIGVGIDGATDTHSFSSEAYTALPNGGAAPFSYSWTINGIHKGVDDSTLNYANSGSSYTVGVTVTDGFGGVRSSTMDVTVTSCPDHQISC